MRAPVHHILPLATIERERVLPVAGKVLVKLDQKVASTDVIAEATWSRDHVLIDVARKLGISSEAADRLLRVKTGDKVAEAGEIAISPGFIPRIVRAPSSGRVVAAGGGQVLLETGDTIIALKAGLSGTVIQVIPNRGAVIRAVGALIQGYWGNGKVDTGLMLNLTEKPDDVLTASRLDVSLRGSVILGGVLDDAETIHVADSLPVRGLILSSISPALLTVARQVQFPVVVTEGFGRLPMNSVAYKLLTSNAKREVTLNAESYDRYSGVRPEVIIPLPVSQEPPLPRDVDTLAPGQIVRLRRAPHVGEIATLVELRAGMVKLPSGMRASAAEVKLGSGEQILVPLVNLEIVG
jgi:hypothetical protein